MAKEEKSFFVKAVIIASVIILANLGIFFYKTFSGSVTGMSVGDSLSNTLKEISTGTKIFLAVEWLALLAFVALAVLRDRNVKSNREEIRGINVKELCGKHGTEMDALYILLQKKKKISLSNISRLFSIDKDTAMDWAKILESGNLAEIDYSAMGEPVIQIR